MVLGYIERLPIIPMTPSNKADRNNLPAPKGPRFVARDAEFVDSTTEMEKILANTLADSSESGNLQGQCGALPV